MVLLSRRKAPIHLMKQPTVVRQPPNNIVVRRSLFFIVLVARIVPGIYMTWNETAREFTAVLEIPPQKSLALSEMGDQLSNTNAFANPESTNIASTAHLRLYTSKEASVRLELLSILAKLVGLYELRTNKHKKRRRTSGEAGMVRQYFTARKGLNCTPTSLKTRAKKMVFFAVSPCCFL